MGSVEKDRICCMNCRYWRGCLVIATNKSGFTCTTCYCDLFEPDNHPTFNDKLKNNNWKIPEIIHS